MVPDLVGEQDGDPPCSGVGCCRSRVSRGEHEPAELCPALRTGSRISLSAAETQFLRRPG